MLKCDPKFVEGSQYDRNKRTRFKTWVLLQGIVNHEAFIQTVNFMQIFSWC